MPSITEVDENCLLFCADKPEDFDDVGNLEAAMTISNLLEFFGGHEIKGKPLEPSYVGDDPDVIYLSFPTEHQRDCALAIVRAEESGGVYDE